MANKATSHVIRGSLDWAKVLGKARPHTGDPQYDKGPSWSFDLTPDEKGVELLKSILSKKHFAEKMKEPKGGKDTRTDEFVTFRQYLYTKDGDENKPIPVIDASGNDWPQDREIGNGTVADVMFRKVDFGTTVGLYPQKIRILKIVDYEGGAEFAPLSEDDEFFGAEPEQTASRTTEVDDTEDEVPF